ncbi:MAG: hypothetical protein KDD42_09735, partial [Bdellovibrionales bacterium]|nr:hypothetical protein [Bdellovibrionales bacterium]
MIRWLSLLTSLLCIICSGSVLAQARTSETSSVFAKDFSEYELLGTVKRSIRDFSLFTGQIELTAIDSKGVGDCLPPEIDSSLQIGILERITPNQIREEFLGASLMLQSQRRKQSKRRIRFRFGRTSPTTGEHHEY